MRFQREHRGNLGEEGRKQSGQAPKVREYFNQQKAQGGREKACFSDVFYVIYNLNPGKIWCPLVSGHKKSGLA
jgi:hypothetical protein